MSKSFQAKLDDSQSLLASSRTDLVKVSNQSTTSNVMKNKS